MVVHVRYKSLYISLPSSAKQREMTNSALFEECELRRLIFWNSISKLLRCPRFSFVIALTVINKVNDLRPQQTRTHCCGHIVAPFARARNICCGHKFCVRDIKNVSDFVQKHFVSATNVSQFAQPKKHHGQQCVRNNVSLFTRAFKAKFRRRISHEPNRMQMSKILCSPSLAFDSAHVKYGVWTGPKSIPRFLGKIKIHFLIDVVLPLI